MTTRNSDRDYSKSFIYKLCCNDVNVKDVYVGSTLNFKKRKSEHKTKCYREKDKAYNYKVYQFIRANGGWDNFDMILIEQYEAKSKLDLHARERHWLETLNATLNGYIPTRTDAEYYKDNIEYYNEYHKQYRKNNSDKINRKITCKCGGKYTYRNTAQHQNSLKHQTYISQKSV